MTALPVTALPEGVVEGTPQDRTAPWWAYPDTFAETTWPTQPGTWLDGPRHHLTRLLDLRGLRPNRLQNSWRPGTNRDREGRVTGSGLHVGLEHVDRVVMADPTRTTWALTLSENDDPRGGVAILIDAASAPHARSQLALHGLDGLVSRVALDDCDASHLHQVYRALMDPERWCPRITEQTGMHAGTRAAAALWALLHLAQPRVPTFATAQALRPLTPVVPATTLRYWLSTDVPMGYIHTAGLGRTPIEHAHPWLDRFPLPVAAAWTQFGPRIAPEALDHLAVLIDRGWQPPTLLSLLDERLASCDDLPEIANLTLPPLRVVQAVRAGLTWSEIADLPAEHEVDWASLAVLASLRDPAPSTP